MLLNRLFFILVVGLVFSGCKRSPSSYDGSVSGRGETTQRQSQQATNVQEPNEVTRLHPQRTTARQSGPTVLLFDEKGQYPDNRLSDFMYFVPLISPVLVTAFTSQNNTQGGHILSYESGHTKGSFYVACEFRMEGKGFYIDEFDDDAMVDWNIKSADNKKVLKNILDYIKFEGEGYGRIEARGEIADSTGSPQESSKMTVENVEVRFNARGAESPVTVGLYDVDITKKTNGHYRQYNKKVARITTLTFNRSETVPRLELKISAVGKDEESLGTWEHVKGFVGNFFIEPIEIDRLGNDTMLDFGLVLYKKELEFTFPKARNLKDKE